MTPCQIKNPAAVELGKLGGQKGGKARAAKLTPTQRSDFARRAARARWTNTEPIAEAVALLHHRRTELLRLVADIDDALDRLFAVHARTGRTSK